MQPNPIPSGILEPDEPVVVICLRTTVRKNLDAATVGQCAECGHDVWVAPSSLAILKQFPPPRGKLVCRECMPALAQSAENQGEDVKLCLPGAMLEEVVDQLSKNTAHERN